MTSPDFIDHLEPGQIIVVGTNYMGEHAGGAAAYAMENFGLQWSCGEGLSGQTYALPTIGWGWEPLELLHIKSAIEALFSFARFNPNLTFLMTKVACGIAGHNEENIKKLFIGPPENVWLPKGWDTTNV